ncbi:MAG: hypothetical protein A2X22_04805 [Bacteroidetes bacterium GWF2_49_14]|nr:MAG: hypothetical protein A2X22_04805 [Bacteroidetes bacterium GWF2_49_14]HBB93201.1 hypothetical protein [Bacteroidales bacterium]
MRFSIALCFIQCYRCKNQIKMEKLNNKFYNSRAFWIALKAEGRRQKLVKRKRFKNQVIARA